MPPSTPAPPPSAPAAPRLPPAGRKFPCQKCGARLDFDPACRALHCPYCGFVQKIEPATHGVQAVDWDDYWRNHAGEEASIAGRSSQVSCSVCGAVVLLEDRVATDRCPYCASFLQSEPESAKALIPPHGLLPFAVAEHQASEAFHQWVARRWFAPNAFHQLANLGRLTGVYVPFWTFDSMTCTHYTGERGDDYTVTETYTEHEANGQAVNRTRQVTHTRWTAASGEVRHFFENVLVCASQSLPKHHVRHLKAWELDRLEAFKPDYLSGFLTERYTVALREGFDAAREIMEGQIRMLCCQDIGGDHQQLHTVNTQHVGVTFKHVLLPVWLAAYRYGERSYQVLVNGRTGQVVGSRPFSWIKLTLLILAILAAVLFVLLVVGLARGAVETSARAISTPAWNQLDTKAGRDREGEAPAEPPSGQRPQTNPSIHELLHLDRLRHCHPSAPYPSVPRCAA
jgi:DNA-directed RNA polymerase subunit RPC12/RpoP